MRPLDEGQGPQARQMRSLASVRRAALFVLVAGVVAGLLGCQQHEGKSSEAQFAKPRVKVQPARLGTIRTRIYATGDLRPTREAKIGTKVAGRVFEVRVDEGARVKKDDVLVVLDQTDFKIAVEQARAEVETASASVSVAQVALEKAMRDWERFARLHKQKAISDQDYEDARTALRLAQKKFALARATEAQARTRLQSARQRLADSVIRAPFAGVVVARMVNEGEYVGPMGPPLLTLVDLSKIKVEVGVPEEEAATVRLGQVAQVRVDAFPDVVFEGKVITVNPHVDPASRAFNVQIEVKNDDPQHFLTAGMFARISLITGQIDNVVLVPSKALVTFEGRRMVFVLEGSCAVCREVKVGQQENGFTQIVSGVEAAEPVIVEGNFGLSDGQEVLVQR